jgi:hypothetical protein
MQRQYPPSSAPPLSPGPANACCVCGAVVKIVASTGLLYRHGHGHGRPPCAGSGHPPQAPPPPTLDASADLFEEDPVPVGRVVTHVFTLEVLSRATLRRIPRGARQRAAQTLDSRLRALLAAPADQTRWQEVLRFADCLSQPLRGGRRHNLTTQLLAQFDRAAKGLSPTPPGSSDSCPHPRRGKQGSSKMGRGEDDLAAYRASAKLQEGDIKGAVRCLTSEETLAPSTAATLQALHAKHPPCPPNRRAPPVTSTQPLTVTPAEVKDAIKSFAPGSAGGRDGLRPQHLKDMVNDRVGGDLCKSLADFANLVLGGGVPEAVRPIFFGASLLPFTKKDGGIRPVAVGLTLRRLVAKLASSRALVSCTAILAPVQLGVGTRGGAEALVHAACMYVQRMDTS